MPFREVQDRLQCALGSAVEVENDGYLVPRGRLERADPFAAQRVDVRSRQRRRRVGLQGERQLFAFLRPLALENAVTQGARVTARERGHVERQLAVRERDVRRRHVLDRARVGRGHDGRVSAARLRRDHELDREHLAGRGLEPALPRPGEVRLRGRGTCQHCREQE